jgi:hypothetical protein
MTERPRMTVQVSNGTGLDREVEILLNPAARRLLVSQLEKLDRGDDHLHVFSFEEDSLALSEIPYRDGDQPVCALKISLRYDDWDEEHFPHVMKQPGRK